MKNTLFHIPEVVSNEDMKQLTQDGYFLGPAGDGLAYMRFRDYWELSATAPQAPYNFFVKEKDFTSFFKAVE